MDDDIIDLTSPPRSPVRRQEVIIISDDDEPIPLLAMKRKADELDDEAPAEEPIALLVAPPPRKRARTTVARAPKSTLGRLGVAPTQADPTGIGFSARRLELRGFNIEAFDKQIREGMRRFLTHHGYDPGPLDDDAALRDVMKPDKDDPDAAQKRRARDGNKNAQFRPEAGFRASGFGVWTHLRGLEAGLAVTEEVADAWNYRHTGGVPHLIAKLPSDDAKDYARGRWKSGTLEPHIDGGSFADAYAACVKHAAEPDLDAWGVEHGEQMLAHLQIGRTGHTCTLWYLTPWRYGIVLSLMRHGMGSRVPALPESKWTTSGGPQFYKHDMHALAAAANAVIAHLRGGAAPPDVAPFVAKLEAPFLAEPENQVSLPDIVPGPMIDLRLPVEEALTSPTVIAWKTMLLHWVTASGPMPRYTFTMPLAKGGTPPSYNRGFEHLQKVARWKDAPTDQAREKALAAIRADKTPWAGGQVHKHPGPTEAANIGFWREAMAGEARVRQHIERMSEGGTDTLAALELVE